MPFLIAVLILAGVFFAATVLSGHYDYATCMLIGGGFVAALNGALESDRDG